MTATVTNGFYKGYTPLHWAVVHGHTKVAELLIEKRANVNSTVTNGYWKGKTLLDLAGNDEMDTLLRKAGATK